MVHQLYIGLRRRARRVDYVIVHQATEWNKGAVGYTKGMNWDQLSGYIEGVDAATLGNMCVTNGIPEGLAKEMKISRSERIKATDLEELLKLIEIEGCKHPKQRN